MGGSVLFAKQLLEIEKSFEKQFVCLFGGRGGELPGRGQIVYQSAEFLNGQLEFGLISARDVVEGSGTTLAM